MKKTYEFIFVVVIYRNADDLIDFIENVKNRDLMYRIVIVNSFHNEDTKKRVNNIALENDCDFINVENKGYGYGNNVGIKFASMYYNYKYIVVSNPDVLIRKFDKSVIYEFSNSLIAPIIYGNNRNLQNPYWAINCKLAEYLIYLGYKRKNKFIVYSGIIINKIIRESFCYVFRHEKRTERKIFAAHGSFVLIPKNVIEKLEEVYDENMFLFAEEAYLAHILKNKHISTVITKRINVYHKEDGSMKFSNVDFNEYLKKSIIYYYENYVIRKPCRKN